MDPVLTAEDVFQRAQKMRRCRCSRVQKFCSGEGLGARVMHGAFLSSRLCVLTHAAL